MKMMFGQQHLKLLIRILIAIFLCNQALADKIISLDSIAENKETFKKVNEDGWIFPSEIKTGSYRDLSAAELSLIRTYSFFNDHVNKIAKVFLMGPETDFEKFLDKYVTPIANDLRKDLLPYQRPMYYNTLKNSLTSQLILLGQQKDPILKGHMLYTGWEKLNKLMREYLNHPAISNSLCSTNSVDDQQNRIRSFFKFIPAFSINHALNIELLSDNEKALEKRIAMIKTARQSIDILTWGVFDGSSTQLIIKALEQQQQQYPDLQTRIIIDRLVKETFVTDEIINKLKKIPNTTVIEFNDPLFSFGVQHRKVIIVDNKQVLAGSRNFSDNYLKNIYEKYEDLDIYFEGPAVTQAHLEFEKLWKRQIKDYSQVQGPTKFIQKCDLTESQQQVMGILSEQPSEFNGRPSLTLMTILNAIRQAKKSIKLANAYLIEFPVLMEELKAAAARNVSIDLFTNSAESNDSPIINVSILQSAQKIKKDIPSARIFLKKGYLLHHKSMVVDDVFSMVGSYNIQPRSERIDGEFTVFIWDSQTAKQLSTIIDNSLKTGVELTNHQQIKFKLPNEKINNKMFEVTLPRNDVPLILRIFYDQL